MGCLELRVQFSFFGHNQDLLKSVYFILKICKSQTWILNEMIVITSEYILNFITGHLITYYIQIRRVWEIEHRSCWLMSTRWCEKERNFLSYSYQFISVGSFQYHIYSLSSHKCFMMIIAWLKLFDDRLKLHLLSK